MAKPGSPSTAKTSAKEDSDETKIEKTFDMLKKLQESAIPVPICVACTTTPPDKPDYLGEEYHGRLAKGEDKKLVEAKSGRYIIRDTHGVMRNNEYALVFNYAGNVNATKLVYIPSTKKFKTDPTSDKTYESVLSVMTDVLTLYHKLGTLERTQGGGGPKKVPKKSHNFNLHTYLHPKWCDHCKEFLWGVFNQGFKCSVCNLSVHKFCKDDIDTPCELVNSGKKTPIQRLPPIENANETEPTIRRPMLPDFRIKCKYFRSCSFFLSAYNIRDIYINMAHPSTRCFCKNCLDEHLVDFDSKITLDCFPDWTVHQFHHLTDTLGRNVSNWEVVYFPIKPKFVLKMIKECFDPPGDESEIDLLVAKDFQHTIEDMTNENYSHKFVNSETADFLYAQLVLEMYIKPKCYDKIILPHNDPPFDTCDIQNNHFRVKKTRYIYPKSILLRIFGEGEMGNNFSRRELFGDVCIAKKD